MLSTIIRMPQRDSNSNAVFHRRARDDLAGAGGLRAVSWCCWPMLQGRPDLLFPRFEAATRCTWTASCGATRCADVNRLEGLSNPRTTSSGLSACDCSSAGPSQPASVPATCYCLDRVLVARRDLASFLDSFNSCVALVRPGCTAAGPAAETAS